MAIKSIELAQKGSASGSFIPLESEREYNIVCDEPTPVQEIYSAFRTFAPRNDEWGNMLEPESGISIDCVDSSGKLWTGRLRYKFITSSSSRNDSDAFASSSDGGNNDKDFPARSFSSTGVTSQRNVFVGSVYGSTGETIAKNSILYNEEGVNLVSPTFTFEIEKWFPKMAFFQMANLLGHATGTVNQKKFLNFAPGTVLFMGCSSGSLAQMAETQRTPAYKYWKVGYQFAFSPDVLIPTEGGSIVKRGWDAYWRDYVYNESTRDYEIGHFVAPAYASFDFNRLGVANNE